MSYQDPTKKREWAVKDRAAHPEKYRAYQKRWRLANPDKVKARSDLQNRSVVRKYSLLKYLSKKRGFRLEITKQEYQNIAVGVVCYFCGGPLSPTGMGLDRLDNRDGYVVENVVPCCGTCNSRKGSLEMAGFIYPRTVELLKELNMTITLQNVYTIFLQALCIWREARGESAEAQRGVLWVILNRAASPRWWGVDPISVILKPFQFSSFNKNDPNAVKFPASDDQVWNTILEMSAAPGDDPTGGATSYYDTSIPAPAWTSEMTFTIQSGSLRFYKL